MWMSIDFKSNTPINRQIYGKIKDMILNQTLRPGEKLPSTRALARELNVSRNTVLVVYDQLIAEGYIVGVQGSKTMVADYISLHNKECNKDHRKSSSFVPKEKDSIINFRSGIPDLEHFPRKELGKLYQQVINTSSAVMLRYSHTEGVLELRSAISAYMYRTRGIHCSPDRVMIVSGATQGLSLVSSLLFHTDQEVIVEDPLHPGLLKVISTAGYRIHGVPTDDMGMITDMLKPSRQVSFIYTTPSHQYPLGGILPLRRRMSLIQYALDNGCYIIEDDYDSEFRYEGQPINALYELHPDKVIYIGSFSKILAPAIRLGFILLPEELLEQYKVLKMYTDVHTDAISQYVLAEFIQSGGLEKHIWKMKKLYSHKRRHLLDELEGHFPGEYEIRGQAAGLHLLVHFHEISFTKELIANLKSEHIKVYPVEDYTLHAAGSYLNDIILGYAHLTFSEISEGIASLSKVIHRNE
jgi:GntR family transcriptional regulator/MocR family aminotransferase